MNTARHISSRRHSELGKSGAGDGAGISGGDSADRYSIGPLVTLALDAEELQRWAFQAATGAVLRYAVGRVPPRDKPVWQAARAACDAGLVTLTTRRLTDGQTEYLAERITGPIAIDDPKTPTARVFGEIARCAAAGEPMPTDAALRLRCGLKTTDQASYALRVLREPRAGAQRVQIINWGPREHRQAIILATGAMTPRKVFS